MVITSSALDTFTVQVAVIPLLVLAVIVAVPPLIALTTPLDTDATLVLLLDHVTLWLVASLGV